jgi:hypothetical protein
MPDSYERHTWSDPANSLDNFDSKPKIKDSRQLPLPEREEAKHSQASQPGALTQEWLEQLGHKRVIFMMLQDCVLVLAAQDPFIVGKKFTQGSSFGGPEGSGTWYCPRDRGGESFFIPIEDRNWGLVEITDPQEEKELLRLGNVYSPLKKIPVRSTFPKLSPLHRPTTTHLRRTPFEMLLCHQLPCSCISSQ